MAHCKERPIYFQHIYKITTATETFGHLSFYVGQHLALQLISLWQDHVVGEWKSGFLFTKPFAV